MISVFSKRDWKREGDSDLDGDKWVEWTNRLWTFAGESRPWEGHPAPFPEELPRRLIKLLSFADDVVCNPFCGSGTTAVVARRLGGKFYGYDLNPEHVASAKRRLEAEAEKRRGD
jgi:DNA modification methylase